MQTSPIADPGFFTRDGLVIGDGSRANPENLKRGVSHVGMGSGGCGPQKVTFLYSLHSNFRPKGMGSRPCDVASAWRGGGGGGEVGGGNLPPSPDKILQMIPKEKEGNGRKDKIVIMGKWTGPPPQKKIPSYATGGGV